MMPKLLTTATVLALYFLSTVEADCCSDPHTYCGLCADGLAGAPWCGVGKCDVLGCTCEGGCRQETYDGCIAAANCQYTHTLPKPGEVIRIINDVEPDDFNLATRKAAIEACKAKHGGGGASATRRKRHNTAKRQEAPPPPPPVSNNSTSTTSGDLFSIVNTSKTGNLTISEYLAYVKYMLGAVTDTRVFAPYAAYFHDFDKNDDGVIQIKEHYVESLGNVVVIVASDGSVITTTPGVMAEPTST